MFGLRRHRARVQVAPPTPIAPPLPAPQLSEEELFDVVRSRLEEFVGATGDWTLVRRSEADTDEFFQSMTAFSVARDVTASILASARGDRDATATPHPTSDVTLSGFAGFGASVLDFQPVEDSELVTRPITEKITFELDTIAVWADPKRHDPAHVNPELVNPRATDNALAKVRAS